MLSTEYPKTVESKKTCESAKRMHIANKQYCTVYVHLLMKIIN